MVSSEEEEQKGGRRELSKNVKVEAFLGLLLISY